MPFQLSPTIIVGIGTTGLNIVQSLRELLYEEFQTPALPIIRFAAITTERNINEDGGSKDKARELRSFLSDDQFTDDYQKIKIIQAHPEYIDFSDLQAKLTPGAEVYDKGLEEWFSPEYATLNVTSIPTGAGNIRQLGRLLLWRKWSQITGGLEQTVLATTNYESIRRSQEFIQKYLKRKNKTVESDDNFINASANPRIIFVGSLLGGTCSGMVIDLAYHCREHFTMAQVYGLFTIADTRTAAVHPNLATNCYTALIELDYYTQDGHRKPQYDYLLPNTNLRTQVRKSPFDLVSLVSLTNQNGLRIADEDGIVADRHVNKMGAISLFADIMGDRIFDSARTNLKSNDLDRLNYVPDVEGKRSYYRFISSLGATSLWYPKARIAAGATAMYLLEIIDGWLGAEANFNPQKVEDEAKSYVYRELLPKIQKVLLSTKQANIEEEIKTKLRRIDYSSNNLNSVLKQLDDPEFSSLFVEQGYYDKLIYGNMQAAFDTAVKEIDVQISRKVDELFNSSKASLPEMQAYVEKIFFVLSELGRKEIVKKEKSVNWNDWLQDNIAILNEEEGEIFTRLIFMREKIANQHFEWMKQKVENVAIYLLSVLSDSSAQEVCSKLFKKRSNIDKNITDLSNNIKGLKAAAKERLVDMQEDISSPALKMVTQENTIKEEIAKVYDELKELKKRQNNFLENSEVIRKSEGRDVRNIYAALSDPIQRDLLLNSQHFSEFDFAKRITSNEFAPIVAEFTKKATPMVQINSEKMNIGEVNSKLVNQPHTYMLGDKNINDNIHIDNQEIELEKKEFSVNHMMIFFREQHKISINSLSAFEVMKAGFGSGDDRRMKYSHRDANIFDVSCLSHYRQVNNCWGELIYTIQFFSSQLFKKTRIDNQYIFEYIDTDYNRPRQLQFSMNDLAGLKEIFMDKPDAFTSFIKKVNCLSETISIEDMRSILDTYITSIIDKNEQTKADAVGRALLKKCYPNN